MFIDINRSIPLLFKMSFFFFFFFFFLGVSNGTKVGKPEVISFVIVARS